MPDAGDPLLGPFTNIGMPVASNDNALNVVTPLPDDVTAPVSRPSSLPSGETPLGPTVSHGSQQAWPEAPPPHAGVAAADDVSATRPPAGILSSDAALQVLPLAASDAMPNTRTAPPAASAASQLQAVMKRVGHSSLNDLYDEPLQADERSANLGLGQRVTSSSQHGVGTPRSPGALLPAGAVAVAMGIGSGDDGASGGVHSLQSMVQVANAARFAARLRRARFQFPTVPEWPRSVSYNDYVAAKAERDDEARGLLDGGAAMERRALHEEELAAGGSDDDSDGGDGGAVSSTDAGADGHAHSHLDEDDADDRVFVADHLVRRQARAAQRLGGVRAVFVPNTEVEHGVVWPGIGAGDDDDDGDGNDGEGGDGGDDVTEGATGPGHARVLSLRSEDPNFGDEGGADDVSPMYATTMSPGQRRSVAISGFRFHVPEQGEVCVAVAVAVAVCVTQALTGVTACDWL